MNKIISYLLTALILISINPLSAIAKSVDKEEARSMIMAYKNKDQAAVKASIAPFFKKMVDENFFNMKEVKGDVEDLQSWDGKIRGIAYESSKMGEAAVVYYADSQKEGHIKVFMMTKFGNKDWTHMIGSFSDMSLQKFKQYTSAASNPAAGGNDNTPMKGFQIELADGKISKNPSVKDLKESLAKLNSDIFFIILSHGDDYIQAAIGDNSFSLEYQDSKGHFSATTATSLIETEAILVAYIQKDKKWHGMVPWVEGY